jgi:hypothetical protein
MPPKNSIARHNRCDVYCGARETVGGSSVSSGCWGEDSNHENGWAAATPTLQRPILFMAQAGELALLFLRVDGFDSPSGFA